MRKVFLFLAIISWALPFYAVAQDSEQASGNGKVITMVADEWCPYNCTPDSDNPGYMVELAKQVFESKGYKIEYRVVPWERAIEDARKGEYNAIIGAAKDDAPDFIYPDGGLGLSNNVFFVKSESSWKYEDVKSLEKVSLGVIEGYTYEPIVDEYISKNAENPSRIQSLSGDTALSQNFKKLEKGRVDVVLENMNVAQKYIADNDLWGKFKIVGSANPEGQYVSIAFSPYIKESQEYAKMLSAGVEELRKSGKLKEILSKYNVQDWLEIKKNSEEEDE